MKTSDLLNTALLTMLVFKTWMPDIQIKLPDIPNINSAAFAGASRLTSHETFTPTEAPTEIATATEIPLTPTLRPATITPTIPATPTETPEPLALCERRDDETAQDFFHRCGGDGNNRWWIRIPDNTQSEDVACENWVMDRWNNRPLPAEEGGYCLDGLRESPDGCWIWNLRQQACECWKQPCESQQCRAPASGCEAGLAWSTTRCSCLSTEP